MPRVFETEKKERKGFFKVFYSNYDVTQPSPTLNFLAPLLFTAEFKSTPTTALRYMTLVIVSKISYKLSQRRNGWFVTGVSCLGGSKELCPRVPSIRWV